MFLHSLHVSPIPASTVLSLGDHHLKKKKNINLFKYYLAALRLSSGM